MAVKRGWHGMKLILTWLFVHHFVVRLACDHGIGQLRMLQIMLTEHSERNQWSRHGHPGIMIKSFILVEQPGLSHST